MASTERLPSGRYRGIYTDSAGKKQRVKGTYPREKDALDAAQEEEVKARRRAATTAGTLPARTTWGDWWDTLQQRRTFDSDTGTTEHYIVEGYLRPRWGKVPLNRITHLDVQEWIEDVQAGKHARTAGASKPKPAYVHRIFSIFNVSIKTAMAKGVLTASPCAGIKLPKRPKGSKPYMAMGHAEKIGRKLRQDYRDAVDFDLETGLRPGELVGLHACRIDREARRLEVCEVYVKRRKVMKSVPKDSDTRYVPLTTKAIEIIDRRLEGRDLDKGCGVPHTDGSRCTSPLVFLTLRKRVMNQDTLGWHLRESARKAGLPTKTPYAMRRGFATRAAEGGANAFELADVLGHADINETQGYVQATTAAGDKLRAALGDRPPLRLVDGERGIERGTSPDSHALRSTPIQSEEDAV